MMWIGCVVRNRVCLVGVCVTAVWAPVVAGATPLGDRDVTRAVERLLEHDTRVPAHRLKVSTVNGITSLTGNVPSLLAKERAVRDAQSVKGVLAVIDRITVRPQYRPDAELEHDVRRALVLDPATDAYEVRADVHDGVVTLTGTVQSWVERQLAADVVKGVKGVKEVRNRLLVFYRGGRPDGEMEAEIEGRIATDAWLIGSDLDVRVSDADVVLTGTVPSVMAKSRATLDAWVPGVESVDNSAVHVDWEAREDRKSLSETTKADTEIQSAVVRALLHDPRVLAFEPDVDVRGGIVTLSGVVDNVKAKRAAEQDAQHTVGVVAVINRLQVRPEAWFADETIARNVNAALAWDPFVDRFDFGIRVRDGVVLLYGFVDSLAEKQRAEDVTARVNGVVDVINRVSIYPFTPAKQDQEIREAVERQLFWSPFVDADQVKVSVRNGTVFLRGVVDSPLERQIAGENAVEGGATMVFNHLGVQG